MGAGSLVDTAPPPMALTGGGAGHATFTQAAEAKL